MEFNQYGKVKSVNQIKSDRVRRGYCGFCPQQDQAVKCYGIKKKLGGLLRENVPLTIPGLVYKGTCLKCFPECDPDKVQAKKKKKNNPHHRHLHRQSEHIPRHLPTNDWRQVNSVPNIQVHRRESMTRQYAVRDLQRSLALEEAFADSVGDEEDQTTSEATETEERNIFGEPVPRRRKGKSRRHVVRKSGHHSQHQLAGLEGLQQSNSQSSFHPDFQPGLQSSLQPGLQSSLQPGLQSSLQGQNPQGENQETTGLHGQLLYEHSQQHSQQHLQGHDHEYVIEDFEKDFEKNLDNFQDIQDPEEDFQKEQEYVQEYIPEDLQEYVPDNFLGDVLEDVEEDVEEDFQEDVQDNVENNVQDILGDVRDVAYDHSSSPLPVRSSSGQSYPPSPKSPSKSVSKAVITPVLTPVSNPLSKSASKRYNLPQTKYSNVRRGDEEDDPNMTFANPQAPPRPFIPPPLGHPIPSNAQLIFPSAPPNGISAVTLDTCFGADEPSAITGEALSDAEVSTIVTRSIASYQIQEPAVPPPTHQESTATDVATLREVVADMSHEGGDDGAIEVLAGALIIDNSNSMSQDLATFCLTTLWILARKSEENKNTIILKYLTLDAIIETMHIYRKMSSVVQARGCGVLWSLSMRPQDGIHVVQAGACQHIVTAIKTFKNDDSVQVMAIGALKVLSFLDVGRTHLCQLNTSSVLVECMSKHMQNPSIQSDACVVLCNLAVDNTTQIVQQVGKDPIDAIINAILVHSNEPDVHDVACFTLLRLSALSNNVETMRNNRKCQAALELALEKHPETVGKDVQILMVRLGLFPSSM